MTGFCMIPQAAYDKGKQEKQEDLMKKVVAKEIIKIPKDIWGTAETKEDLEDWLLSHDAQSIKQLRHIRSEEDLAGKGKTLEKAARQWNIKL